MKKILYSALCVAALATTSCSDFLETSSPSVVDGDFVFSNMTTARAAMDGTYEAFRDAIQNDLFGDGLYYASDIAGSDIERHPESYTAQLPRHEPECFYVNGTVTSTYNATGYQKESPSNGYARCFKTISNANAVISAMEAMPGFDEQIAAGVPTEILNLYGEAIAIRATCYRELIKYYGDVPYNDTFGEPAGALVGRDSIYEACIADLINVEPIMYRLGEKGTDKNQISRTYVQGLIGRMALEAGGYHTRRSDIVYHDIEGNVISFEQKGKVNASAENAVYNRRTDYKKFYEIAKTYFGYCIENSGTAKFHLTDPRKNEAARQYNNPYQYFFEQMHQGDEVYADESIYEIAMTMGSGNDARPYSFGRPSSGGSKLSKNAGMPCKNYGQGRINPAFYYGMFDPNDMRRDVSVAVTGSNGNGSEAILPIAPNSQAKGGGLSLNKWDENRQAKPYSAQRKSGINAPYMRMAEVYLGYAEACAMTGDNATAKQYLKIVRERSFPAGKANTDAFIASRGSLVEAIIDERGFEYAGEGDRRYTLIRSGFIGEKIKATKDLTKAMIDGLKANGYYQFENGNVISNYVYTKLVDAKSLIGYRLTAQASEAQMADPEIKAIVYPSWRGQHDDWASVCSAGGFEFAGAKDNTNLAIQGLFEQVDGEALKAAGYSEVEWGKALVANEEDYYNKFFNGYDFVTAPVYLWPFTPNVVSTGGFRNGYGFQN